MKIQLLKSMKALAMRKTFDRHLNITSYPEKKEMIFGINLLAKGLFVQVSP